MRNKTLTIKSLKTPRPLIFVRGFINGRFKTADINQESSLLTSAYVIGTTYLFNEFCQKRVAKLETDLSAVRMEAQSLLLELRTLPKSDGDAAPIGVPEVPSKPPSTLAEAYRLRAAARTAAQAAELSNRAQEKRDEIAAKRAGIITRLAEIKRRIMIKERLCCEELGATEEALRERFCIYGHGVLLKPINARYIPHMDYNTYLDRYYAAHNALKREIDAKLKEGDEQHDI